MLYLLKDSRSRWRESRAMRLAFALALGVLALLTSFAVTYADDPPPNEPPVIEWFLISEGPMDTFDFFGYVSDPDNSTEGYVVQFGGTVEGQGLSATVGPDGSFDENFIITEIESGTVTADTEDPQGAPAETVGYWLDVTQP